MAHNESGPGEPDVRDHLIGRNGDLRQQFINTAQNGGDKELEAAVHKEFDPLIDALLDGKAVRFHRYELPDDHRLGPPRGGHPNDWLVIGEDDVVRPDTVTPRSGFAPNRAERRAAGFRGAWNAAQRNGDEH